nr:hypothetical protein [Fredinandcohnia onubensis]
MKVFMVHSFSDFTEDATAAETRISYDAFKDILAFFNPEIKLTYLKNKTKTKRLLWMKEAKKKIRESNYVLYIDSASDSKNIKKELKYAYDSEKSIITLNYHKIKVLFPFYLALKKYLELHKLNLNTAIKREDIEDIIPSDLQLHKESWDRYFSPEEGVKTIKDLLPNLDSLIESEVQTINGFYVEDKYSGDQHRVDWEVSISELQEKARVIIGMQGLQINENKEFEHLAEGEKMQLLLEQYKIFVQSSESLMTRRQNINSFYITANTVLVALFAAVVALKDVSQLLIIWSGFGLSVVGIVITRAWKTILLSYGKLNSSKIKVISAIEKRLPVSLYDLEWSVMSNDTTNGGYKPFTKSEATTAATFFWSYIFTTAVTATLLVIYYLKDWT